MLTASRLGTVLAIAVGLAGPVYGQARVSSQVPRYTPSTPTTSPYLNLLNRNGTPATNYYGLVRPLLNQRAINQAQAQTAAVQEQQIKSVKDQQQLFEQPNVKPTGTAAWFKNEGTTSPFQNTNQSHYYGQWPASKSPRRGH